MAQQLLLMADVPDLGGEGDVVTVADGYARNYLIPKNLAAPLTAASRARLEKQRKARQAENEARLAEARKVAAALAKVSCTIAVKTGDDEQLYGSVTRSDIARTLAEQGVEIDRHSIVLESPLKELGVFDVKVKLHPELETTIKVWVVEE